MTDEVVTTAVTQPPGNIATAAGTLMRGFGDSFRTRLTGVLLWLLLMPLSFVLALWILGVTLGATDNGISIPTFFLLWSVIGGSMQATQFFREWPARLRSLWLRHPGDRLGAWKLLETTLWGDISLIIVVATTVAVPFGLLTDVDKNLLALYVLGSGVLTAFSSYFGFLTRIAGWHSVVHALSFVLILSVCIAAVISVRDGGPIPSLYVTLLMLAAIAAVFRAWSRRRLLSIDWCAVRPTKVVRAGLIR